MSSFLLIPHLKIHNANAMSSPYTIGFPAMTAWLGAVHALQRHIKNKAIEFEYFKDIQFVSVAVSCHQFNLQVYKGTGDFVFSIINTANPLDKDGGRPAFVEEARCHLEVSLLVEYQNLEPDYNDDFMQIVNQYLLQMKFAGGDVLSVKPVEMLTADEDDPSRIKKLCQKLMLGYVLIERRDLIIKVMQEEDKDALDAVLGYLQVIHCATKDDEENVSWTSKRKEAGWLVPIAIGFQGISDLAVAKNQRDIETPHRFCESVVTLGEFVMPYRITNLDKMLWRYHVDLEKNLYLCQTKIDLLT